MSRRTIPTLAIAAILSLAACSPGATTGTASANPPEPAASAPAESAPAASAPAESAGASAPAASDAGAGAACAPSTTAGTVQAGMAGTAFVPAEISGKVGDTITWTDNDTLPHTATLKDDPACTTDILQPGSTGSLTFSAAGTYALICKIHLTMSATVTITQ